MKIHFAPIQGHTDMAYRVLHAQSYRPADFYYSPFIRWERGGVRLRDIKDIDKANNSPTPLIPQIIFRDRDELRYLTDAIAQAGYNRIDLNMGCPFPLQTARGRGAALSGSELAAKEVLLLTSDYSDIEFSIKMRLGLKDSDEWKQSLPILNEASLRHITIHPRNASQQYGGEVDLDRFQEFIEMNRHRSVYNGDIRTPEDFSRFHARFPQIDEVMIGRGLLSRPSLTNEIIEKKDWEREKRIEHLLRFHRSLLTHYKETLCGDSQILGKIKPFWEYSEAEIGRKAWKQIHKAVNMPKYQSGVAMIEV
ncbi:MAG: tRNA-dihydrouridine synthase family protein [Bacteroides sp.]|nr:tRNA-dihydrouridine synthase family protein [Bacteroides sp.]